MQRTLYTMKIVFFGTSAFAVPSLERLAARQQVRLCVTQPDQPQGRGLKPEPSPVALAAQRLNVPLRQLTRLDRAVLDESGAEAGVVVAYGTLIPRDALAAPRHGMLGVHPSLLPKYRGAAPVAWALLNGETTTGVTIFRLNERLDAGDIVVQETASIEPDDDAQTLTARLARLGAEALVRAVDMLEAGRPACHPQDDAAATLAPKLTKAQGRVAWAAPAETIARQILALVPWPGAGTTWQRQDLKLWAANAVPGSGGTPGTVVRVTEEMIEVATGRGTLVIREVQLAGRTRMRVREFLRGHRVNIGDHVGDA